MSVFDNLLTGLNKPNINGLNSELKAILINNQFKKSDNSVLFLTSSLYEANKYYQILSNYTKDVVLFPMDDFLTSEALAISPDLKISRLEVLSSLMNDKKIVVTNLMGYLRFLPMKDDYINSIINLKIGDTIEPITLSEKLL